MEHKHSPGPWVVVKVKTCIGHCWKVGTPEVANDPHGAICLYDDHTSLNPLSSAEIEANAKLIARAPDLLQENEQLKTRILVLEQDLNAYAAAQPAFSGDVSFREFIARKNARIAELETELAKVNCSVEKEYCVNKELYLQAAENMYWPQVVLNGGPPCFHLEDGRRFCGRAQRWAGHDSVHKFMSLADLLRSYEQETTR